NVWYTRGLDRIGCFLCPASDIAESEAVAGASDRYAQWDEYLDDYTESRGLPPEWKEYQLWRWKNVPQSVREYVSSVSGKEVSQLTRQEVKAERGPLTLRMQEGYSPCTIGYSVEGALSRPVDLERLWGFAHVLGSMVELAPDGEWLTADYITVFREGSIMSKAAVERDARSNMEKMFELIIHSEQCVGCSLCVARCKEGALRMVDGKVEIEPDLCIRCRDCLGPCPAVNFRADAEEDL
ncbi:MAG: 3'-phosphoadenosine 5'-phosphosulfate sulfotransferase, partial [Candidatus Methanomethylophilaceae archaeon]